MTRTMVCAATTVLALAHGVPAAAQPVVTEGRSDVAVDRRLERLLRTAPLVVDRDTLIARNDTIRGSVLVLDATLVHEGVILGDLVLVDASGFVRPRAVVAGDLVNIAGGLYRSEISEVGGAIFDLPVAPYRVVRESDRLVILATDPPSRRVLHGLMGFHPPTYDRVNGLTLVWGAGYRFPAAGDLRAEVHGQVGWQTERGDPTGAVRLTLDGMPARVAAGHERAWATRERWIRGDLMNSLVYLWNGQDLRDYHEVDRTWIEATRELAGRQGGLTVTGGILAQTERASSLRGGQPWFLLGSETRPNPPIDDGRISSIMAGIDVGWDASQTRFAGRAEYERAGGWIGGDFRFDRITARGSWAMLALANHTLAVDFFLQTPPGGATLPRQRWSFVGGTATLHTLEIAEFRGDRVAFVDTRYIIPLPDRLALPLLGAPRLQLLHAAGMAWTVEESGTLHQEIGAVLDLAVVHVRYALVPDDPGRRDFSVSLAIPVGRTYPWER
jgi:hypothetical protein